MIKKLSANKNSFKEMTFDVGLNVLLADKTEESGKQNSRNGLGKSTFIEIIHFCLGADFDKSSRLNVPELEDWEFILTCEVDGSTFVITRSIADSKKILVDSNRADWFEGCTKESGRWAIGEKEWKKILGKIYFNIDPKQKTMADSPSFRGLMGYFVRKDADGYTDPFAYFKMQPEGSKQVHNSFLLGLNWEYAVTFKRLKDSDDSLKEQKKRIEEEYGEKVDKLLGVLESQKIQLEGDLSVHDSELKSFKVHPQYHSIQNEADIFTAQIKKQLNDKKISSILLNKYRSGLNAEVEATVDAVKSVYTELGMQFSAQINKRLEEVIEFHKKIVSNRKEYLSTEIERLERKILAAQTIIEGFSNERAKRMEILETHGALNEHSLLQSRRDELNGRIVDIQKKIKKISEINDGLDSIDTELKELRKKSQEDKDERIDIVSSAIRNFADVTKNLYGEASTLSMNITRAGYKFAIPDTRKEGSWGVKNMQIFSYDLTLLFLGEYLPRPDFLIHDSIIFADVDERQVATALEYVDAECKKRGLQYICTMNSDRVPTNEFSASFKVEFPKRVRQTLTDDKESGSLLGVEIKRNKKGILESED